MFCSGQPIFGIFLHWLNQATRREKMRMLLTRLRRRIWARRWHLPISSFVAIGDRELAAIQFVVSRRLFIREQTFALGSGGVLPAHTSGILPRNCIVTRACSKIRSAAHRLSDGISNLVLDVSNFGAGHGLKPGDSLLGITAVCEISHSTFLFYSHTFVGRARAAPVFICANHPG